MNKYEFPICDGCSYDDIRRIHERVLKIAVTVRDILERNDIEYFITFGTLIGAVRHKGFVPWDRDFDIMIMEDVYDNAIDCVRRELPDWLVIQEQTNDPQYCAFWVKVRDRFTKLQTTVYESDNKFTYCGLQIDLYKMKKSRNVALSRLEDHLEYIERKYERKLITQEEYANKKEDIVKEICIARQMPPELQDRYYFLNLVDTTLDTFKKKIRFSFEGELFFGPKNYDAYLKDCYYKGDYMVPPPYDKRTIDIKSIEFFN